MGGILLIAADRRQGVVGFPNGNAATDCPGNDEPGDDRAGVCVHWCALVARNINDHDGAVGGYLIGSGGSFDGDFLTDSGVEVASDDLETRVPY